MSRRRKFGLSWSWRRAVGISAAKGRLSRATGIPLTKQGRQRKVGRMLGCLLPIVVLVAMTLAGLAAGCSRPEVAAAKAGAAAAAGGLLMGCSRPDVTTPIPSGTGENR